MPDPAKADGKAKVTVEHKFLDRSVYSQTETLIIGTFNPDTENNSADFFYSRGRNHLWRLLPTAFGEKDLKDGTREDKETFLLKRHIDFIDLIAEVEIELSRAEDYSDKYIDDKVTKWRDIPNLLKTITSLKRVCFTRKTFADAPIIREKIVVLRDYFKRRNVYFEYLVSPARFYSKEKQADWNKFVLAGAQPN